jgi:hypothetical protein
METENKKYPVLRTWFDKEKGCMMIERIGDDEQRLD